METNRPDNKPIKEGTTKIVVWSGGMDSTVLLHKIATEAEKNDLVIGLSIEANLINDLKTIKEKQARKNYLAFAKRKKIKIKHHKIKIHSTLYMKQEGWIQQTLFFCAVTPFVIKDCELYFGFVQNDSICSGISYIYEAWRQLKYLGGKGEAKLKFPFLYMKKYEVLKMLHDFKIPKTCVWTCEDPTKKRTKIHPCEKCNPCIEANLTEKGLILKYGK